LVPNSQKPFFVDQSLAVLYYLKFSLYYEELF
jgi:hypothetical protein